MDKMARSTTNKAQPVTSGGPPPRPQVQGATPMKTPDRSPQWRAFRAELKGENGWFDDGRMSIEPQESLRAVKKQIERETQLPCRFIQIPRN